MGILYARELLKHFSKENQNSNSPKKLTIQNLMFSPFYIPETTGIDSLLETMQKEHVHMAIVIDEYGGVAGLVTMEDVLEEIVGDIVDEFDEEEEQMIFELGENLVEVDARVHIDDLNEQYDYGLPEGKDFDTIGGFVITQIGKVPQPGETLTWQQLRIEVLESDERRISKLRIELDIHWLKKWTKTLKPCFCLPAFHRSTGNGNMHIRQNSTVGNRKQVLSAQFLGPPDQTLPDSEHIEIHAAMRV